MATKQLEVFDSSAKRIAVIYQIRELFKYRFLIRNLVIRDLKIRYKRSSLGFIWVTLNPLITMGIMAFVFSKLFRFNQPHYAAFVLSGILLWSLFTQGSVAAMGNLQANGPILRKLHVPPSAFVVSSIGSAIVNLAFSIAPFVIIALVTNLIPSLTWFLLFIPIIMIAMFTLGIAFIVSAMFIFFHDVYEIYQVLVNIFYYLTPVFYPIKNVPHVPQILLTFEQFNPMYYLLDLFRTPTLENRIPPLSEYLLALGFSLAVLIIGWFAFTRVEDKFVYQF